MTPLSLQHDLHLVFLAGLGCHLIFNRLEPRKPIYHFSLLVVVPLSLSWHLYRSNVLDILLAWVTYIATLTFATALYRLSPFHPLARYPGPTIGKLSKFWLAHVAAGGKQHIYFKTLHEQYGDVVRVGPNELTIRDPAAIAPMMGTTGLPKGPYWDGRSFGVSTRGLIALRDPVEHARRRRPWNRAFSVTALRGYTPMIVRRASQLMDALANQVGEIDLAEWFSFFSYDFMSDMAFGGGSEMMANLDTEGIWHIVKGGLILSHVFGHLPWITDYQYYLPFVGKGIRKFRAFAMHRAAARCSEGSHYKDIFHHLMDADGVQKEKPSATEVISDGALAIIAGSDTTSTTLSSLFWALLCHPEAYARLRAEVDALGPDDVLDTTLHSQMPYLNAVINETLRLFPPVISGSQRAPMRGSRGQAVGPYFVPEGTSVCVHFYSLHRDPRYFSPSPDAFLPERWLDDSGSGVSEHPSLGPGFTHDARAFVPFSFGPSICVGKALAYQEMRIVVCLLIRAFEMQFAPGYDSSRWEEDVQDFLVIGTGKLPVVLKRRDFQPSGL